MIDSLKEHKLALISPLKDEINNINTFLNSISNLTLKIHCLVILENDSIDGSKEFLKKIDTVKNVQHFKVLNLSFEDKSYDVEFKYAELISEGIKFLKNQEFYEELDFIGILDSDCFPEEYYYNKLINFLNDNPKMGITSGIIFTPEGKKHIANKNWVRGGCRIWKKECLEQTGFPIAPSPDAITVALAEMKGWDVATIKTAKVFSREVNQRLSNFKNFGRRAYFRGNTPVFAILKTLFFILFKFKPKVGIDFFKGYFIDYRNKKQKINNKEVRQYYKNYIYNKIKKKMFKT